MDKIYGLVCQCKTLQEMDSSNVFKSITRKTFSEVTAEHGKEKALEELGQKIVHNLDLTSSIIDFCQTNGIGHYRLSNSIFGLFLDDSLNLSLDALPNKESILGGIKKVGMDAISKGVSLSIFPDLFNSLASYNEETVERSISEINFYSWFFDEMGLPKNLSNPIIVRVGEQVEGEAEHDNITDFVDRFIENYQKLDKSARARLAIQNAPKGRWNCINLFKYFHVYPYEEHDLVLPLSYDNFNDMLNPSDLNSSDIDVAVNVGAFNETWRGVVPTFVWSEKDQSNPDSRSIGYSEDIPEFNYSIKWECDSKGKDKSILEFFKGDVKAKISEEEINKITRKKYQKASDAADQFQNYYNALYNGGG